MHDSPERINESETPRSIYQAIISMSEETRREIALHVFGAEEVSDTELMEKIEETNTCSNLNPPVEVWIDSAGEHRLRVFDSSSSTMPLASP